MMENKKQSISQKVCVYIPCQNKRSNIKDRSYPLCSSICETTTYNGVASKFATIISVMTLSFCH